jgi:hypothetical protein
MAFFRLRDSHIRMSRNPTTTSPTNRKNSSMTSSLAFVSSLSGDGCRLCAGHDGTAAYTNSVAIAKAIKVTAIILLM